LLDFYLENAFLWRKSCFFWNRFLVLARRYEDKL